MLFHWIPSLPESPKRHATSKFTSSFSRFSSFVLQPPSPFPCPFEQNETSKKAIHIKMYTTSGVGRWEKDWEGV